MSDEIRMPDGREIRHLPRWAKVAFAARCARRVQPLFQHAWPEAPAEHVEAIDKAITLTETDASRSLVSVGFTAAAANAAAGAANAAARAANAAARAANAAAHAVRAAEAAVYAANAAARAANAAAAAAAYVTAAYAVPTRRFVRADFDLLLETSRREKWTDETPVPPEFFGPMWPDGTPDGWPEPADDTEPSYLKVEVALPKGLDDAASDEANRRVAAFFAELSAMHVAMGGTGLRLVDRQSSEAMVPSYAPLPDNEPVTGSSR